METELIRLNGADGIDILRWTLATLAVLWWGLAYIHRLETLTRRTVEDVPIIALSGIMIAAAHVTVTAMIFFPRLFVWVR